MASMNFIQRTPTFIITIFLTALLLASCASRQEPVVLPTETRVPTLTESPTGTPTSSPSPTKTPTETPSPTWMVTQTPSPPTSTNVPTLVNDEAYPLLLELLRTNEGCQLPCWWGIIPGESTQEDARRIMMPLSGVAYFYSSSNSGGIGINYPKNDVSIDIYLEQNIYPDESAIEMVYISTIASREIGEGVFEPVYDENLYNKLLNSYTLPQILSVFGIPTEVLVRAVLNDY